MKIKVIYSDKSEKTLTFDEYACKSVMAKYSQLVSEGEIESFELV